MATCFPSSSYHCDMLQGMIFDLEKEYSLHVDLARSNSRSKRSRAGSPSAFPIFKMSPCSSLFYFPSFCILIKYNILVFACFSIDDGVAYSSDKRLRGSTAYSRGLPDSGNIFWSMDTGELLVEIRLRSNELAVSICLFNRTIFGWFPHHSSLGFYTSVWLIFFSLTFIFLCIFLAVPRIFTHIDTRSRESSLCTCLVHSAH